MARVACKFCGREFDTRNMYQRVFGWERRRDAGGPNQITLREVQQEWSCESCVERIKRNIATDQLELT